MKKYLYRIGVDISSESFAASALTDPNNKIITHPSFINSTEGFNTFETWLNENGANSSNSVICLEATGVYSEELCYWLSTKNYTVALEPPLAVKRAFYPKGHKTDSVDSRQIAEYAFRYEDKLHYWKPANEIIEQIKVLLSLREHYVEQKTANVNALQAISRKVIQSDLAAESLKKNINILSEAIADIEREIKQLIDKDNQLKKLVSYLASITSVGFLLAVNFLAVSQGFSNELAVNHRKAAAYVGICPYQFTSGTSVYKKPKSFFTGPSRMRKLLYLASLSAIQHNEILRRYYYRKIAEGKSKKLVLNNVANKLLKIMCALVKNENAYIKNYVSIHPRFLKNGLTLS